ncbi:Transposon Tf2-11 polyprotein [Rhizoctonia solani]|uniref:Transposon Tf2-11 polyprotein n=1 Tax=Rhizoctonia solani TaxID=456999 RepID=A0A0K6G4T2_9AGAM|nr:Transposon Tf2-11 polyprotein [Rhizoctonia solani]
MTPAESKELRKYLDKHLAKGTIQHSKSPAGAPVMFVKKSDGSLRLCMDYRKLNNITIKNRYPLPLQQDLIEKLQGVTIFTKLDLRWGYNNVWIREGNEWKTAFRTKYGHFEYKVMPFGLTNAPATFQHFMNDLFQDMIDVNIIVYLDDILIYSKDPTTHEETVKEVLQRLRDAHLYCKPLKCMFSVDTVPYLGLVVSPKGISMEAKKVQAVQEWPEPKTIKQIHRAARPLHDVVKSGKFYWGEREQMSMKQVKDLICNEPVLAHANPDKPFVLETDASGIAMGAILSQKQEDGRLHPIAFMSKSFQGAEKNYNTHNKELLVIICALKEWRIFLEGCKHRIHVISDHRNLEYWKMSRTFNRRHNQWFLELAPFDFTISHWPGKLSEKPDALSRRSDHGEEGPEPQIMLPEERFAELNTVVPEWVLEDEIQQAQGEDPSLEAVLRVMKDGVKNLPKTVQEKFKRGKSANKNTIIQWLGTREENEQGNEYREEEQAGTWEKGPRTANANTSETLGDSILTFMDRLTKMVHYIPCREQIDSEEMAELFMKHVWKLHGTPRIATSDRGTQFASKFMRALYKKLDIKPHFSTAYHPQTDGQSEHANKMGEQYLQFYVDHRQTDWVKWLPLAKFAFNSAKNRQTGFTPFELNSGFNPEISPRLNQSSIPAADELAKSIQEKLEEAKVALRMSIEKEWDEEPDPEFEVGDKVWLNAKHISTN